MRITTALASIAALTLAACGGSAAITAPNAPSSKPPSQVRLDRQIVTKDFTISESVLARRAEIAFMSRNFAAAASDYELLIAADAQSPDAERWMMNLATAYEGLEQRDKAVDVYREIAERFPKTADARTALIRVATISAYLEDWQTLGDIAAKLLARKDIDKVDRIVGLGARALAAVETAKSPTDTSVALALKDVVDGLDLAKTFRFGGSNVLPVAFAQLKFAEGEVRRVQAESITFATVTLDEFSDVFDSRSNGVLSAQASYADAVRSVDPHWALMASDRVGEMYRAFHRDLMAIPAPAQVKTDYDHQVFYAFMHVRYRALLEKGMKQMQETVDLGKRLNDKSLWMKRALDAKQEMDDALADEKAELAKYPFTEETMTAAIKKMIDEAQAEKSAAAH